MAALSSTSSSIRYSLQRGTIDSDAQLNQILEVRLNYVTRLVSPSPSAELPHQILRESHATPMARHLLALPLRQLEDSFSCQLYVVGLLSSLNFHATAYDILATDITSFAIWLIDGNHEANFHIVANIDYIQMFWMEDSIIPNVSHTATVEEETLILESPHAPTSRGAPKSAMERLRKEKFEYLGEELGDCSVCYDELTGGKAVIRMPCRHVYHESCILKWLSKSNSCPLCRSQLPE